MRRSCKPIYRAIPAPVRYYYDLVRLGTSILYYADLVSSDGEVAYQTEPAGKDEVIAAIKAVYPSAELLNTFA